MSKLERRYITGEVKLEARENADSRKISGYAAVFNKASLPLDGGWFREKINQRAFDKVLGGDTACLFNHDTNLILARNKGTLKLSVDEIGLRYEFDAPQSPNGDNLLESIRRGDIVGSSFSFTVKEVLWRKLEGEDAEEEREVMEVGELRDVGPVTFPAYPDTDVFLNSLHQNETQYRAERDAQLNDEILTDLFEAELKLY